MDSHNWFETVNRESNVKDRNEKMKTALNFKIFKTSYNWLFHRITSHLYIPMEM